MKQHTVKIGIFSKKDLETKEGKRMSKALCRLARPRAVASWNNPNPNTERARIMRELDTVPASNDGRILAAFEDANSKAIQLHELLVRLVEMTKKPSKRYLQAKIVGFDQRMRKGKFTDLEFIREAFLMGAEVGADADLRQVIRQTTRRALVKTAEQGFDNAMLKRDHKTRPPKGPEPRYDDADIKSAVAEIKKRVKDGKGKLTLTKAVEDVRSERRLWKIKVKYLYRECYERKSAKTAHK